MKVGAHKLSQHEAACVLVIDSNEADAGAARVARSNKATIDCCISHD